MDHRQSLKEDKNSQSAALPQQDVDRRDQSALGRTHGLQPADPGLSTRRRPVFPSSNVSSTADSESMPVQQRATSDVPPLPKATNPFGHLPSSIGRLSLRGSGDPTERMALGVSIEGTTRAYVKGNKRPGGVSLTISRDSSADEMVRQAKLLADMGERSKKNYNGNNMRLISAEPETDMEDDDDDEYSTDEEEDDDEDGYPIEDDEETKVKVAEEAKKAAGDDKEPIRFTDAVLRKYNFPWSLCAEWNGMEALIKQAFEKVEIIGPHVREGHYDLHGPDDAIILPMAWGKTIQPGWQISMRMWPADKPRSSGQ